MNKILREEMEYLITCDDKAITPDVRDDVSLTLQYIDELENKIDKAIEYINSFEEDNPDYNSNFYNDYWCKNGIGFEDLVENTTKILRGGK
jgi:hypothetical protein